MEESRISIMESLQKEKQIVVDPLSLEESYIKQQFSGTTLLPTVIFHPPPLLPPKSSFLSLSLPNSATSSPRFAAPALSRKKSSKGASMEHLQCQASNNNLTHKHSDQHLLQEVVQLQRSKSCGEGKACDELDHWFTKPSSVDQHGERHHHIIQGSFSSKTEAVKERKDEGFKCSGLLCLYIPAGFGKLKPVKARNKGESGMEAVMSRTVSLENFECGSWASSSAISHDQVDNSSFDLPMELIKCRSANDVYSPVNAALVFEKDLKLGVLKKGSSSSRGSARKLSDTSPRHSRFSTSSSSSSSYPASPSAPFIISPRLRKAREDFKAFLAAEQSA